MKTVIRKLLTVMLAAVFTLMIGANAYAALPPAFAKTVKGQCGENVTYTWNTYTGEVTISGTGDMYDYNHYFPSPFYSSDGVRSVVIGKGVTRIGEEAFSSCYKMESVSLPDTLLEIGEEAFLLCEALKDITIPDSVQTIGEYAFLESGLENVTLPNSVDCIEDGTFYLCTDLTNVSIPNKVKSNGTSAFEFCYSLATVTLPKCLTTIKSCAFSSCKALRTVNFTGSAANWKTINIPSDVFQIPLSEMSFNWYSGVEGVINAIKDIGKVVFSNECKEKIETAQKAYAALSADKQAQVDADALKTLHDAADAYDLLESKAAFEEYKESLKALADGMKREGDPDACDALIGDVRSAVDAVEYDESKTLDKNKKTLDDAAALDRLAVDLAEARAAAEDPHVIFESYRATVLTQADAMRKDGDSEAVAALIDEAIAALTEYAYDEAKTLAENEKALNDLLSLFEGKISAQRKADRQEELNHRPCSLCHEHHTGSLLNNFIGVFHGLIWIVRCFIFIAA